MGRKIAENSSLLQSKATISVKKTQLGRVLADSEKEEVISVRKFETEPATVSVSVGVTRNMGNFESLRLNIGVTIPCYLEEITEVEKQATDWVDDKIASKLDELVQAVSAV
jgi:hypothetical protein